MKRFAPFSVPLTARRWALLPLRLSVGLGFAAHGFAKLERGPDSFAAIVAAIGVPAPRLMAWMTAWLELAGGTLLALGVFVVLLTPPLIIVMLTALFRVHLQYGFSSVRLKAVTSAGAVFGPVGYEMNLLYIVALLAIAAADPTPLSFDRWRLARRGRSAGGQS